MLMSPNRFVAQSAACVGYEGACITGPALPLGVGWLASTKLGQAALALFGFGAEVQGMADGVPPGVAALSASKIVSVKTGDLVERIFAISKGDVDFIAEAVVKGDRLILNDAALYARGENKVLTGMTRDIYK